MGVYFSANDVVYEWAIAFLNSFRTFNPDLRLILIPFNNHCNRILALQDTYQFEIYQDPAFTRLEAIGQAFELGHTPTGPYWFRRYAAFWGLLERFMYLDVRQVVLADLQPLIAALDNYQFDFLHYDCAINQVYEPGLFRQSLLRQGRGRGFLSGLWASRRGLFSIDEFEQLASDALTIRDQLNPRNTDQAFINYCCDIKPVRYGHLAEVVGEICQNSWARQPGQVYGQDGKYYLWDYGGLEHKKQVVLIHWAGYQLDSLTPNKWLFQQYRFLNRQLEVRRLFQIKDILKFPVQKFISLFRQNRKLNAFYHKIRH